MFTASNGITVERWRVGADLTVRLGNGLIPTSESADALREFFQHERDTELGRWRFPENPDYVVYPEGEAVRIVRERPFHVWYPVHRGTTSDSEQFRAARAYFDAHPVRKPWHDAKPGEIWVLSVDGRDVPCRVTPTGPDFEPLEDPDWATIARGSDRITSARRIWPEGGES